MTSSPTSSGPEGTRPSEPRDDVASNDDELSFWSSAPSHRWRPVITAGVLLVGVLLGAVGGAAWTYQLGMQEINEIELQRLQAIDRANRLSEDNAELEQTLTAAGAARSELESLAAELEDRVEVLAAAKARGEDLGALSAERASELTALVGAYYTVSRELAACIEALAPVGEVTNSVESPRDGDRNASLALCGRAEQAWRDLDQTVQTWLAGG